MGTQYPLSYLKGAAVVLDAAPAASSLRNGPQVALGGQGGDEDKFVSAIPRPKKRLIGRGPVDFMGVEMLEPSQAAGGASALLSASALHDSVVMDDEYSLSKLSVPAKASEEDETCGERGKRSILMIGSLRVDISSFECIMRVRSGCYLLPQAGARAIVVVLEIPPKRPRMVEGLGGEDDQYVLIESTGEEEGGSGTHPAIESFEDCLKEFVNLVAMDEPAKREKSEDGSERPSSSYSEEGEIQGTALREIDQNHLIKFANSVFAECDHLLVNTSTKQGVAPVLATSIKATGNVLCKTLLTTSSVAGTGVKVFGKALREVLPAGPQDTKVSEATMRNIESAEWIGQKAVNASEFVVSTTSKAVQYTGKVVSDKILQSNFSKYWTSLEGAGSEQNGFFQTMGTILDAMITSAVDLQLTVQKSAWCLLTDLKDTAIDLVDHKYGADAAEATGKATLAAMNVGSAASVARGARGLAKGLATGVAKESGEQITSLDAMFEGGIQAWGMLQWGERRCWGVLTPHALALYSHTELVQERPSWTIQVRDISEVRHEKGEGSGCSISMQTRSHGHWSLRLEDDRWYEALQRCIQSNERCKLLGCTFTSSSSDDMTK